MSYEMVVLNSCHDISPQYIPERNSETKPSIFPSDTVLPTTDLRRLMLSSFMARNSTKEVVSFSSACKRGPEDTMGIREAKTSYVFPNFNYHRYEYARVHLPKVWIPFDCSCFAKL